MFKQCSQPVEFSGRELKNEKHTQGQYGWNSFENKHMIWEQSYFGVWLLSKFWSAAIAWNCWQTFGQTYIKINGYIDAGSDSCGTLVAWADMASTAHRFPHHHVAYVEAESCHSWSKLRKNLHWVLLKFPTPSLQWLKRISFKSCCYSSSLWCAFFLHLENREICITIYVINEYIRILWMFNLRG